MDNEEIEVRVHVMWMTSFSASESRLGAWKKLKVYKPVCRTVQRFLRNFKKPCLIILVSFVLSIIATLVLQYVESTQIKQLTFTATITISDEIRFGSPFKALIERSYFDSLGDVYVYMHSPYADYWSTFQVWMSLDNSSWENVPFLEAPTDNISKMAYLGCINLYDPQLVIYVKYYIPPQTILLPSNVTKEEFSNVFANVWVKRHTTPADTVQWIAILFMFFTGIGFILDLFLRKES